MVQDSSTGRVFEALRAPYRRQLLFALLAADPQSDDNTDPLRLRSDRPLSDDVDADRIRLVHNHLPKLDGRGYIDWEPKMGKISKGPHWDEIAPLLNLIHDHHDVLPDEVPFPDHERQS